MAQRWSLAEHAAFRAMVAAGVPSIVIAQTMGRPRGAIQQRKHMERLIQRYDRCQRCGTPITQPPVGRTRQYCTAECLDRARKDAISAQRAAARQTAIENRADWTCAADGCNVELPRNNPRRKFCCRDCSDRDGEQHYRADGRRRAAGLRAAAKSRARSSPAS